MDIGALLYGYRAINAHDVRRKALALRSAYNALSSAKVGLELMEFLDTVPEVAQMRFGGSALDSYVTSVLSIANFYIPHIDVFAGAVLNAIVLQMTFQTRLAIDGVMGPPEAILYEGDAELFSVAMIHANEIVGIHLTDLPQDGWMPAWLQSTPLIEIRPDLIRRSHPANIVAELNAHGRSRIGAVLVVLPDAAWGDIVFNERYASVADRLSRHTIYSVIGAAEMVLVLASVVRDRYPDAKTDIRLYSKVVMGAVEHRAVLVFSGIAGIPDIKIVPGVQRPCTFIMATPVDGPINPSVEVIDYYRGAFDRIEYRDSPDGLPTPVGRWEQAGIRHPFYFSSSAPLPEEARVRISQSTELYHSVVAIPGGILSPSEDIHGAGDAVYVSVTADSEVLLDYSDEFRRVMAAPIYAGGWTDHAGSRHGTLKADRILRVEGAAMPLLFTPMLHRWHSHFMIQCLPRVRVAKDLGRDIKLLVPHDMRAKQLEMLAVLGFGADRVVKMPHQSIIKADELLVPRAWQLAFTGYSVGIYDDIVAHFASTEHPMPSRILISRESRKTWRNMLNYDSLKAMLVQDHGFVVVAPEKLSLQQEVALYANADIVVGAEGAGMYGAVFSKPGSVYLTICDEDYVMPILGTIAEIRNIELGYVFGESLRADSDVSRRLAFGHADFVIDLERVEAAVLAAADRVQARA